MEKFLVKLFDIKRIPTKLFFVVWLSYSLILFVPEQFLTKLNLQEFLNDYGKFIGISFVISSGFLIVASINFIASLLKARISRKRIKQSILKEITNLDYHERVLLREFYINGKHTLQLPLDNDTVVGLLNKHIIYQASGTGFTYLHGAYFPYSITNFARENITNKILELPENPSEEDKRRIFDERPNLAKERNRIDNLLNSYW